MRRPGEVISQLSLLEHAWDYDYENRSNVVEVYVGYLRQKIDRPFGVRSLETVRGAGYRLRRDGGVGAAAAALWLAVSRVPIRWRLTAAFALAMVVVLAAAAVFVYLRLEADLNDSINSQLESGTAPADPEEGFARVVSPGERVDGAILSREELSRARDEPVVVERSVPGVEGEARILARPGSGGDVVVVAAPWTARKPSKG